MTQELDFYRNIDRENTYTLGSTPELHSFFVPLHEFISKFELSTKKCLEIGSSKGLFQDIVDDYIGVDISESLSVYYHKPYFVVDSARLPFPDEAFDAIWTYAVHEHIPEIEFALDEIVRVLKPGGVCFFAPAWHTRPWFAEGLAVRPYAGLTLTQKIRKALIPLRDAVIIRWPFVLLRRTLRLAMHFVSATKPEPLRYRRLAANYQTFWQSDSDACNSLDPFDVILWFRSRGFICHGYRSLLSALLVRTVGLMVEKPRT